MKTGIIGAGKVGFTLGKFFSRGGIEITGYYSRNPESARQAAAFTDSSFYDNLEELIEDSDAIFITVPDGAITEVYRKISRYEINDKYICHCSGAMSAGEAFPEIDRTGAHGFSIHPLFPISSRYEAYRELSDAFFCLEGEEEYLPEFEDMLKNLGCRTQRIEKENKILYHAACTMASNLVCGLVRQSQELLTACGFSEERAAEALKPLISSNVKHILEDGVIEALTGPAERGDAETVRKHLDSMPNPETRELYRLLTCRLADMAEEKNAGRDYTGLRKVLSPMGHAADTTGATGKIERRQQS